jgi:ribosomal-protein-alanine N-acetyltransferase
MLLSPPPLTQCRPLTSRDLDAVMRLEVQAYDFPWTRGNFVDSLLAGYWAHALFQSEAPSDDCPAELLAYAWAMAGVGEVHLLNITVARSSQGRGYARFLLDYLVAWCQEIQADDLWLEVRPSNARAIALYERYGFETVGRRPNYYPANHGRREDATVMSLQHLRCRTVSSLTAEKGAAT